MTVEDNFKKIEQNIMALAQRVARNTRGIADNKTSVDAVLRELSLMKSRMDELEAGS